MTTEKDTEFGAQLIEAMEEALAWKRGEKKLQVVRYDPMPPERIRAIRKLAAKSAKRFQQRFGIPARTVEGWEQGIKKPDVAARVLLNVIAKHPEIVESVVREANETI